MRKIFFMILVIFYINGCQDQNSKINNISDTNLSCVDLHYENLKIAKLDELVKKAENGDKRLMYLLSIGIIDENISRADNYWNKKLAEAGDISSQHMLINIADEKNKAKLIKQWHFEDYIEYEKNIGNSKSLPMPQNILDKITKKAENGDILSMNILQDYYPSIDKKKYIFWHNKLAEAGDISAQSFVLFEENATQALEMAKRYHLELQYFKETRYELLNKGIVEYRDDDPQGVFFDENGSVIKYE